MTQQKACCQPVCQQATLSSDQNSGSTQLAIAPARLDHVTTQLFQQNISQFIISQKFWSSNSPYLNPVDDYVDSRV